uniref:Ergothioneine biosynthesis protein 1-like isoform X2 n=1 Tax=Crassostrea virginica TaxID=6565 RepID=A0A8B8CNG7_CRAVI|nr:ergothioneine biosynthesis protein 1-like isoform X2 [Crassostrea virginica]
MAMGIRELLLQGLNSDPKYIDLSCRYDEQGSKYDEECTNVEDYYYYKAEEEIVRTFAAVGLSNLEMPFKLFELGCGSTKKSQIIIDEILRHESGLAYGLNDLSADFLEKVCEDLFAIYGSRLKVDTLAGDFMTVFPKIRNYRGRKVLLWLGGLQCFPLNIQPKLLLNIASTLQENDACLISSDITQDREKIEKAYMDFDDSKPNSKLYKNGVHVLNRELKSNIDLSKFELEGRYVENKDVSSASYIQVWLRSLCSLYLKNVGKTVTFGRGEKLLLYGGNGLSHKYTLEQLEHLFASVGLQIVNQWDNGHSALTMVKRKS